MFPLARLEQPHRMPLHSDGEALTGFEPLSRSLLSVTRSEIVYWSCKRLTIILISSMNDKLLFIVSLLVFFLFFNNKWTTGHGTSLKVQIIDKKQLSVTHIDLLSHFCSLSRDSPTALAQMIFQQNSSFLFF